MGAQKDWDRCGTIQVDYQTEEQYIITIVLKYKSDDLIIFHHCTYSGLSIIMKIVIQNSMRLIRSAGFDSWINRWLEWSVIHTGRE